MANSNLVSVIVPVYNVKPYLRECFDSICRQSYRNIEIILVDDGSTDGSGELCDVLAASDDRTTVLHKENGGLSDARNAGLRIAQGDWISFVDSDDYISPVFIEVLFNACRDTGCQISAVPFGKPFNDGYACPLVESLDPVAPAKALPSPDVQRLMLYQTLDTGAPWRLYAKAPLGIDPFPKGLYYEDLASVYKIIHKVDSVAVVDCRELYAYRMRSNSIIRQEYRHIKGESALIIADRLYQDICNWYPDLSKAAASRCFSVCRMVYAQIPMAGVSESDLKDRDDLWNNLSTFRLPVLKDFEARKRERLAAFFACCGRRIFSVFCSACRLSGLMQ